MLISVVCTLSVLCFSDAEEKRRSIRFQDEEKTEDQTDNASESVPEPKATTPLQAAMLKMAAEKAARLHEQSAAAQAAEDQSDELQGAAGSSFTNTAAEEEVRYIISIKCTRYIKNVCLSIIAVAVCIVCDDGLPPESENPFVTFMTVTTVKS